LIFAHTDLGYNNLVEYLLQQNVSNLKLAANYHHNFRKSALNTLNIVLTAVSELLLPKHTGK